MSEDDKDREIRVLRAALDIAAEEVERKRGASITLGAQVAALVNQWVIKGTAQVAKEDKEKFDASIKWLKNPKTHADFQQYRKKELESFD